MWAGAGCAKRRQFRSHHDLHSPALLVPAGFGACPPMSMTAFGPDRANLAVHASAQLASLWPMPTALLPKALAIDPDGAAPYVSDMATLPIITLPNPLLRKRSAEVERIDAELGKLADDMLDTMYAAPGVGLAAVQVGVPRRLIVIDAAKEDDPPAP